jgi:uncharacterized lipoprotein YehR (DUF1307 family)
MRKILTIFSMISIVLSLVGCGQEEADTNNNVKLVDTYVGPIQFQD